MDYQSRLEKISEALFVQPSFAERGNQLYTNAVDFTKTISAIINDERRNYEKKQTNLFPDFLKVINEKVRRYGEPKTPRIENLVAELSHRTYFAAKDYVVLKDELNNNKFTAYPHNIDPKRAVAVLYCLDSLLDNFVGKNSDSYAIIRGMIDAATSYLQTRSERNPSQDLRGTKLERDIKKTGRAVLDGYRNLKTQVVNNINSDENNFEKYVMMVALISTYEGLVSDLGRDVVEKSFGTLEEKRPINTKEKINNIPRYWHSNDYRMRWEISKGQMWGIIKPKSPKKTVPKIEDGQLAFN